MQSVHLATLMQKRLPAPPFCCRNDLVVDASCKGMRGSAVPWPTKTGTCLFASATCQGGRHTCENAYKVRSAETFFCCGWSLVLVKLWAEKAHLKVWVRHQPSGERNASGRGLPSNWQVVEGHMSALGEATNGYSVSRCTGLDLLRHQLICTQ